MNEINFSVVPSVRRALSYKYWLIFSGLLIMLTQILGGSFFLYTYSCYTRLQSRAQTQDSLNMIHLNPELQRNSFFSFLEDMEELIPDECALTLITINKLKTTIKGKSTNPEAIESFLLKLQQQKHFKAIHLKQLQQAELLLFTIELQRL